MLREEVAQLVGVLDGGVLLERVVKAVIVFDATALKVPVLEFVVDAVAVVVGLCVRDDLIDTDEVELVVTVFEEDTLAVEVSVMIEREAGGERDTEVVPVDVLEGRKLVVRVVDPLGVLDGRLDDDILGLPVVVFDELIEPVVVFDMISERVKALVSVPVEVDLDVIDSSALALGVFDARAVDVSRNEKGAVEVSSIVRVG